MQISRFGWAKCLPFFVLVFGMVIGSCGRSERETTQQTDTGEFITEEELADAPTIDTVQRGQIRAVLQELFGAAQRAECNRFAQYIVYTGRDTTRQYRDALNLNDQDERFRAESTCEVIAIWLQGSVNVEYGAYTVQAHPHPAVDSVYQQQVVFLSQKDINRRNFSFIRSNDRYKLINVD